MKTKYQWVAICALGALALGGVLYFSQPQNQSEEAHFSDASSGSSSARSVSKGSENRIPRAPRRSAAAPLRRHSGADSSVLLEEPFKESLYKKIASRSGNPAGKAAARAFVRVPSTASRVSMTPNQLGAFPLQPAAIKETVAIRLQLSDAQPGTTVSVIILDGGSFPKELGMSRLLTIEKWGGVTFQYTTSANDGHHRVKVQPSGKSPKILDFYAS